MMADNVHELAKYIWKRLEEADEDEITQNDLFNACKGKIKTVKEIEPVLQRLQEMHYIRLDKIQTGQRGRPSKIIRLNPWLNKK